MVFQELADWMHFKGLSRLSDTNIIALAPKPVLFVVSLSKGYGAM